MVKCNGTNIVKGKFPNGETQYISVKDIRITLRNIEFEVIFESNEDLFNLLIFNQYIKDMYPTKSKDIELIIRFCPYGQSDREFSDSMGSFKYFAKLINQADFCRVYISDPHSEVMAACLDRCEVWYSVQTNPDIFCYDLILYPDAGAAKKYSEILPYNNYVMGNKKRDLETGKILRYEILADKEQIKGKKIIIIDDLVVRGGTYKYAATALKEMDAERVGLWITHVMPSAKDFWTKDYKKYGIDNVYTANTLNLPWANTPNVPKNNDNSKGFKDEVLNT